eukprot:3339363-Heterocapsa_arctica.AAC.1
MYAILVVGVVHIDVVVAWFPGSLICPFLNLLFVPDVMLFRAAFARLGTPHSQARFSGHGPDVRYSDSSFLAHCAIIRIVGMALDEVGSP